MSRVSRRRSTRCSARSASSRSAWTSPSDCWRRDEPGDMARLLIIDDDVTLRQAPTKHLEHRGDEVRQAADGDAGIRAYERRAADVVIVDIYMPGQGGLQTIGRLRREWPAVKIVAMSGVKSAGAIDVGGHAVALGADRFVTKPFEPVTLVTLVAALLGDNKDGAP